MTTATRATLKSNFATNATPTGAHFANLIDTAIDGEAITYTVKTVASSGADYTTIQAAINAVSGATTANRYRILVKPGTYTEIVTPRDYVDIIGPGWGLATIKGTGAGSSPINTIADCTISGFTIIAVQSDSYAVHIDAGGPPQFTLRDCWCIHREANSDILGCGGRPGQIVTIENCILPGHIGLHGSGTHDPSAENWSFRFIGCQIRDMLLNDFQEYRVNPVVFSGCEVEEIVYSADDTHYTQSPPISGGYHNQSMQIVDAGGNRLGRITLAANNARSTPFVLPSITAYVVNTGGSTIAAGEACKLLIDPSYGSNASTEPNNDLPSQNVSLWNGSGIYYGVAVASITSGSQGVIQHAGRPLVLADASGAAIAYGDALELNSSGRHVKRASGAIVAYARAALSSGTGLIAVSGMTTGR